MTSARMLACLIVLALVLLAQSLAPRARGFVPGPCPSGVCGTPTPCWPGPPKS